MIIPARNAAGTLGESLASLRAQSFPAWEAIVVDDGSTDRTAELARELAAVDPRIRVVSGPGRGPGAARNAGIALARADWLLFLDADDLLEPAYLARMTQAMAGGDWDGALCGWSWMTPDGRRGPARAPEEGDLFPQMARYCAFAIHSCVVRRALVEEVGGFDPSLVTCEDWDLWQRLARAGARFARTSEALALYRLRPGSASHDPRRLLEDGLRVIARGHAPDPRVPRPDPAWAAGRPPREQAAARLLFSCWAGGLAAGRGEDARPLLAALDGDRDPGLDPSAAARSLFQAALLPAGGRPEGWRSLWPDLEARLAAFLADLGERTGARHLAALARREVERLAVEHAGGPRPFTLGTTRAVRIELTRPIPDLAVPAPAERLHVAATLEGEEIGTVELPVTGGLAPAALLADALADRFAWTVLGRFLARQGHTPLTWELFLQEIWGRPGWPAARFYDPAAITEEKTEEETPPVRPCDGLIEVEASGEVPAVELAGPTDAVLQVGGTSIGRVRLLRTEGRMGAHELRAFLTGVSGFELCRAAVREGVLGQPLDAPGTLRERLAEAARRHSPRTSSGSVDPRGAVLARHPGAPLSSPSSRRAFLPAEALPELLDLALVTGQAVVLPPDGPAPRWAEYAPDLFAGPAALGPANGELAAPPPPVYGRRHFEALFAAGADPWRYTNSYEETKYEQTLSLLPVGPIGQALELACAEGHFTVRLAPRVGRLVAADISRIALERAAGRCAGLLNVGFQLHDLTRDPLPEGQDLIVCSEVLYYAGGPAELRSVAERLASALHPGGHLLTAHACLVADEPDRPGFDWDHPFGAKVIGETLATAGLRLVRELRTPLYRIQIFQREDGLSGSLPEPPRIEEAAPGPLPPEIARHVLWNGGQPRRAGAAPDLRTWRLPILLYHRIAPEGAAATARYRVAPEAFAEQLLYLRDSGYHTPRLGDWLRSLESKEPLPGRAVLITFDDGYADFAAHAGRLLSEHGFSALMFLVADAVGGTNRWDEEYGERLPLLGWEEIRRLQAEGRIQFGSHAATHRPLTALSPTEAVRELARSRAVLTRGLGAPPVAIAYPHGAVDPVVQHLAGACGYLAGLTCHTARSGFDDPPLALPRLEVRGDASFADFVALLERE